MKKGQNGGCGFREHLVVVKKEYADAILNGEKQIECRLMAGRHVPFGKVAKGDRLFFKISTGPVCGTGYVVDVKDWDNLNSEQVRKLREEYDHQILGTEEYWKSKENARCGVLIWLGNVKRIAARAIGKRDRAAWVVLSKERNYGLVI